MVPPTLALLQTEFCNPVFEGDESQGASSAEHLPAKDGTSPTSPQDGLGTCLGGLYTSPCTRGRKEQPQVWEQGGGASSLQGSGAP